MATTTRTTHDRLFEPFGSFAMETTPQGTSVSLPHGTRRKQHYSSKVGCQDNCAVAVVPTHDFASDSSFLRAASCSSHRTLPAESTGHPVPAAAPTPPSPCPRAAAGAASPNHRGCSPSAIAADSVLALSLALEVDTRMGTFRPLQEHRWDYSCRQKDRGKRP